MEKGEEGEGGGGRRQSSPFLGDCDCLSECLTHKEGRDGGKKKKKHERGRRKEKKKGKGKKRREGRG